MNNEQKNVSEERAYQNKRRSKIVLINKTLNCPLAVARKEKKPKKKSQCKTLAVIYFKFIKIHQLNMDIEDKFVWHEEIQHEEQEAKEQK